MDYCNLRYKNLNKFPDYIEHIYYDFGNKPTPLIAIFELLLREKGFNNPKSNSLLNGGRQLIASTQLCYDITDENEDLRNGFETLVMWIY